MLYFFKQREDDFQVEELLDFEPSWIWNFLYIKIMKKNINTMDLVLFIMKYFNIKRKNIWIAWLKDKKSISIQRITIHKDILEKIWWEKKFTKKLSELVDVLKITYHNDWLVVWKNIWNKFKIRLVAKWEISKDIKHKIKKNISFLTHNWMLNFFWMQRFWKWLRNYKRALELLKWWVDMNSYDHKFKFQSLSSIYFNTYLSKRFEKYWNNLLDGDILVDRYNWFKVNVFSYLNNNLFKFDYWKCKKMYEWTNFFYPDLLKKDSFDEKKLIPTWPIVWYNILLPKKNTESYLFEKKYLDSIEFFDKLVNFFNRFSLYWIRRPLIVYINDLHYEFDEKNNLLLEFSLPTWSYATVLLGQIFDDIDYSTCIQNNLTYPILT